MPIALINDKGFCMLKDNNMLEKFLDSPFATSQIKIP